MMYIRPAEQKDFELLVRMFKDLINNVYPDMKKGEDIYFAKAVINWFDNGKDVIVCCKDTGEITGFSMAYIERPNFIEPYYNGDLAYTLPAYRKGRTAHLLYRNVVGYAEQLGLPLVARAYVGHGDPDKIEQIQSKFGEKMFVEFHRPVKIIQPSTEIIDTNNNQTEGFKNG